MTTRHLFKYSLLASLIVAAFAGTAQAAEFRAFWADAWGAGFQTPAEVETMLGKPGDPNSIGEIRKNNLNAVIVQVRRRYDTCYPSGVGEPYMVMNQQLTPLNYNALQQILDAAHDTTGGKKRIEVHCWIVTFKTDKGTVYSQHKDTANPDNYWVTRLGSRTGAESSGGNFDPGHPKVLKYIVDACMDLVTRFDIDGLHYDYIRFEGNTEGFNPTSVDRYRARYGLGTDPASTDDLFEQWRRDQVSAVVRQIYARIQATKPWVLHSGSFVTWNPSPTTPDRTGFIGTRPFYDVYSDWDSWIQEGTIDLAVPMTYYDWAALPTDFTKWMNYEKDFTVRQPKHHMYVGPGTYHNNLDNAILELKKTRDASPAGNHAQGYSGYCYGQPYYITWSPTTYGSWANFAPRLKTEVNPTWDDIPARTWKTNPTTGHISGTVSFGATGAWADHAQVSISPAVRDTMYVDGNGFYAFVDLPPGQYTVTASKSGYPDATTVVDLAIGAVTGNMYVRDLQLGGTGPRFSDVQISNVTGNSATITWTTDASATSQVQYGTTLTYGSSTALDSNRVTSHTVVMSGLTANTRYHLRVVSTHDGGTTYSADYTFMTQAAPTVSIVQVGNITPSSATITWLSYPAGTSQVEYGTTTSYGSSSPLDANLVTAHSVTLTGLAATTLYHCRVTSTNDIGSSTSADVTFTTIGPPVITNVQAGSITSTGATITWTTSVAADSQVVYGLTSSYGNQTTLNPSMVTSHSVALTGLSPNTTYHFAVRSANDGGSTQSTDYTFTTLPPAPVISNVQAGSIGDNTATVTWTTDLASTSQVQYGLTTGYGQSTTLDSTAVTAHSVNLTGLGAGTLYHYRVVSTNAGGTATSSDYTFTTTGSAVPPEISGVALAAFGASSTATVTATATITWTTNITSDSQVEYGATTAYGSSTTLNTAMVTSHTVDVTGLAQNTTYHYRVRSSNGGGAVTYSGDGTFLTPIIVDNRDAGCTIWPTSGTTWKQGSVGGVPRVGTNYYYGDGSGSESSTTLTCTWTPNLPIAANYDVYVFYQIGGNRNSAAPFTIFYNGGQEPSIQNQNGPSNTGGWFKIGSNLSFAAGTSGYVQVANNSADTKSVSADAVMFVRLIPDTQAPTVPANVAATAASSTSIQLTWTASTDNVGVTGYKIYRDGNYLAGSATASYTDSGLTPNTSYMYEITASDAAGNESGRSSQCTRVTLSAVPGGDTVTCTQSTGTWTATANFGFTAIGGFGAGTVTKYAYVWDNSPTRTWTGAGGNIWSAGTLNLTAGASGAWYLHLKGFNSENAENPATADLGPYNYDGTAPGTPVVTDDGATTASLTSLHASWSSADSETGIQKYEYQIRDAAGAVIKDWTDVGTDTSVTVLDLSLQIGKTYFFKVRATNTVGLVSAEGTSDGIMVFMFDANNDGRLNESDFSSFFNCSSGATVDYPAGENSDCARFDTNGDNDVDSDDFGVFQRCLNGDNAIDPTCLN